MEKNTKLTVTRWKRGRGKGRKDGEGQCIKDPLTKTKGGLNVGGGGLVGQGRVMGGKMGTTVIEQQ